MRRIIYGLVLLLAVHQSGAAVVQDKEPRDLTLPTYYKALDLAFSRDLYPFEESRRAKYHLIIRFQPDGQAEAQIRIIVFYRGDTLVVKQSLPQGSKSIFSRVPSLMRWIKDEDAEGLAKHLQVRTTVVPASERIEELFKEFLYLQIPTDQDTGIIIQGTYFQFWCETMGYSISYRVSGAEPRQDKNEQPLIRWMNKVRQALK